MKIDKTYQKELLARLLSSPNIKKEIGLFNKLFQAPIYWVAQADQIKKLTALSEKLSCPQARHSRLTSRHPALKQALVKAKKTRSLQEFKCSQLRYGVCLPLVQGDAFYGFLVLCHLTSAPSVQTLYLLEALNSTILEKMQKELELAKLYQSIRPRAIALSTIHTIHRLINSSLDLDELLPRIARLSLQVLRAKKCVISLVDKKNKHLTAKAIINLNKNNLPGKLSPGVRQIEKKVLRTGNILRKKSYLAVPLVEEKLIGVITVLHKANGREFDNFDQEILSALSEQAVGAIRNAQLYKEQENILLGTVQSLASVLKTKSRYAYTHSQAFVDFVLGIARELKLDDEQLRNLRFAAMLHDAGKIGIPEEILKKPTHLTGKELKIVQEHPKKGAKMLSPLQRLKPAINIILHHHEKFDGTGYPDRLKGEKIPLGARIMAVADSFEAMISSRPYRKSTSAAEAIKKITQQSGSQFDPRVIAAFIKLVKSKSFKKLLHKVYHGRIKKDLSI